MMRVINQALNALDASVRSRATLVDAFLADDSSKRRYVLGRNDHSAALLQATDVAGVIDDFASPGATWRGYPVLTTNDVPPEAIVVNCSMAIGPVTAARRLEAQGISRVLGLSDLCRAWPERFPWPEFVRQTKEDWANNQPQWERLALALEDTASRHVLKDVMCFRLTGDYTVMHGYSVRTQDQYFEDFTNVTSGAVFVDAGGFDGDTTEEFCRRHPDYKKVLLFEPSAPNIQKARDRLSRLQRIEFLEVGLSDTEGETSFNPDAGSASHISDAGFCKIRLTTLDDAVRERVTFIKMDLEGWETKALAGARRHIAEDRPTLAVAVYHRPADFWMVFDLVTSIRPDYRVFLRHYTEGWTETVMYFVPSD